MPQQYQPKYNCGIDSSSGGLFKAWFMTPAKNEKVFICAQRGEESTPVQFKDPIKAFMAAKDKMCEIFHKDVLSWREQSGELALRRENPMELARKAFGSADELYLKGGRVVQKDVVKKRRPLKMKINK